jgi:hypothetical protein
LTALITATLLTLALAALAHASLPARDDNTPRPRTPQCAGPQTLICWHTLNHSQRHTTLTNLRAGLAGTPMAASVRELEAAARKWGLSPYFIAAAAGTESAFGRLACRGNPRNLWGLGACNRAWHVPQFTSWQHAYGYYARFIRTRWPSARTAYDLHGYCECGSSVWGRRTAWHMSRLFGVGPSLIYGKDTP